MMKKMVIVLVLLCLLGCRTEFSSKNFNREYKAGKMDKVLLKDLPFEVKDTVSKIFEWYVNSNPTPCDYATGKVYPSEIILDSSYKIKDVRHVNRQYWDHDAKFWERNGTKFSINNEKFFKPIEGSNFLIRIIFQGQLYVMGKPTKEHPRIFDCKNPNYLRVYYEDYYFWVIDLEE